MKPTAAFIKAKKVEQALADLDIPAPGGTVNATQLQGKAVPVPADANDEQVLTYDKETNAFKFTTPAAGASKTRAIALHVHGDQAVESGAVSFIVPMALTITEVRLSVDTAPVGAALVIDIHKNGTTIYTTQANRPTIAAGATSATATLPDVKTLALGDKISIDVEQIGSTTAGKNLNVTIICTE